MKKVLSLMAVLFFLAFPIHATVTDTESPVKIYTTATVTEYPIPFDYIDDEDIEVTLVNSTTGAETAQTLDVDYTIVSSTVTYATAPGSAYKVVIRRVTPYTQESSWVAGSAPPLSAWESAFDKLTFLTQDLSERIDRSLLLPAGTSTTNTTIPDPAYNAGKYLKVKSGGDGFEAADLVAGSVTFSMSKLSDYASVAAMVSSIGSTEKTVYIDTAGTLAANTTLPSTMHVIIQKGGSITLGNYNLAINGPFDAGPSKCFNITGTGAVSFGTGAVEAARPEWWGAAGDGITDDSAEFGAFMTTCTASGVRGVLAKDMTYYLPSWTASTLSGTLKLESDGATIKGDGASDFAHGPMALDLTGITFDGWIDVMDYGSTGGAINATVAELSLDKCAFRNTTGTCFKWGSPGASAKLTKIDVTDCDFYGGGTRAVKAGFSMAMPFDSASIIKTRFDNMSGRPVVLGGNVYASQDLFKRTSITRCAVDDINTGASSCNGFLVYGREVDISYNWLSELTRDDADTDDGECEGIYTKARYYKIIGNIMVNAGRREAFITVKGSARGVTSTPQGYDGEIAHNILFTDDINTVGLSIQNSEVNAHDNIYEGFARNAIEIPDNAVGNINVHHENIKNCHGQYAVLCQATGDNIALEDLTIDTQDNANAYAGDCAAIYYNPATSQKNVSISRNKIKAISGATGSAYDYLFFISPTAGGVITNLRICDNQADTADCIIRVRNQAPVGFTMTGNQFTNISGTKATWSVTPTSAVIRDNVGYVTNASGTAATVSTGGTIAHSLSETPTTWTVYATDGTALGSSVDGTNITVTFGGGGTKTVNWTANY